MIHIILSAIYVLTYLKLHQPYVEKVNALAVIFLKVNMLKLRAINTSKASETESGIRDLSPGNEAIVPSFINTVS